MQSEREELLDSIRKRLAKMTLRTFFNALHSSGEHTNVADTFKVLRRFGSKRMSVSAAKPFVEGQWLAYVSLRECAKRRLQQVRSAVRHIEDVWSHSSRYAYLSRLSMEHKRLLILCRHENIERRDIMRRHLWHLISTHQKFYNHRGMREAGFDTRTFPTAASSVILFDADDVTNCLAGTAPPQLTWGTGPYHPYSIEHLSGDEQTIRTFERRLFFSKQERQLLLEELDMSATASKTFRTIRDEEREVEEEKFPFANFKGSPRSSQQTLEFSQLSLRDAHHNVHDHQDLKTPSDHSMARSNPVFLHRRMMENGHVGGIHPLYFMNRRRQIAHGKAAAEATAGEQNVVDEETLVLSPWAMEVCRHCERTTCLRAQKDLMTHLLSSTPLPTLKVNTTAVLKMGGYTDANTAAFFNPISASETESSQSPRRARKVRRSGDLHGHVTEAALFQGQDSTKKPVVGAKVVPTVADTVTTWPHLRSRAAMGPHWVEFLNKVRPRDVSVEAVRSNQKLIEGPDGAAGDDGQGGSCSTARHFCGVFSPLLRMEDQPTPLGGEKELGVRLCDMLAATRAPQTSPHTTAQTLVPQSYELAQANPALVESILAYHMERLLLQENVCRYRFQVNCGSILNSLYLLHG